MTNYLTTRRQKLYKDREPVELVAFCVRVYYPHELVAMFERAGFDLVDVVASCSGQRLEPFKTPRMALICRRPQ